MLFALQASSGRLLLSIAVHATSRCLVSAVSTISTVATTVPAVPTAVAVPPAGPVFCAAAVAIPGHPAALPSAALAVAWILRISGTPGGVPDRLAYFTGGSAAV